MSIIGLYRQNEFNKGLRVGTPDPTRYHDSSTTTLEMTGETLAAKLPGTHGYSGLRGTIIPRATNGGASRGHDHMAPRKAFIDPQLTNGQLVVDMAKIQADPNRMIAAIQHHYQNCEDPSDATISAFAEFAEPIANAAPYKQTAATQPAAAPIPIAAPPQPTQIPQSRPASFTKQAAPVPVPQAEVTVEAPRVRSQPALVNKARSLRQELSGDVAVQNVMCQTDRPMRKVLFELPMPGQPNANMGQFTALYHDIVRNNDVLVLVYDHSRPAQMVWFPPLLEDPETHEPLAMPVLVSGDSGEGDILYLAYPTGVRFMYRSEEFCLLSIEKEKPLGAQHNE